MEEAPATTPKPAATPQPTEVKQAKNGAIMLFHARKKDYNCLVKLIPALIDKGYELVTVSELLDFGEIQTSDELYIYNKNDYR